MPELVDVLAPEAVRLRVRVSSKRQLLSEIADAAAVMAGVDRRAVVQALQERERLGSTGVGGGVALPHARLDNLSKLVALFWQLERPVPFDAIDDAAVDLVVVLLVPGSGETEHLKTLAKIARRLRTPAVRARLRKTDSERDAWTLLTAGTDRSAAA